MSSFFVTRYIHAPFIYRNFEITSNESPQVEYFRRCSLFQALRRCFYFRRANVCIYAKLDRMRTIAALCSNRLLYYLTLSGSPVRFIGNLEDTIMARNSMVSFKHSFLLLTRDLFGTAPGISFRSSNAYIFSSETTIIGKYFSISAARLAISRETGFAYFTLDSNCFSQLNSGDLNLLAVLLLWQLGYERSWLKLVWVVKYFVALVNFNIYSWSANDSKRIVSYTVMSFLFCIREEFLGRICLASLFYAVICSFS